MSKRYLGGGVYFEQKNVSQEFSEDDAPSPAASTLAGLTDVDISDPTDGQTLVYNATSGKWENGEGGGGGSPATLVVHVVSDGDDRLDHTYTEISTAGLAVMVNQTDMGDGQYVVDVIPLDSYGYAVPGSGDPVYFVIFILDGSRYVYTTDTQGGYPTLRK